MMISLAVEKLSKNQVGDFKNLIKLYESKNYAQGKKWAEKLLKAVPDHSETKCLHCLFQANLEDDKLQYEELAKKALMKNLKSPFCWNICAMISKLCKKFKVAANSFSQALKYDPTNQTILREATHLFLLARNFEKHTENRKTMLMSKSVLKMNWCGVIVANHQNQSFESALYGQNNLIDISKKEQKDKEKLKPCEMNEVYCYKAYLYNEMGQYQKNLEFLKENKNKFQNKIFLHETFIKCYFKLNQEVLAGPHIETLVQYLPENKSYIEDYVTYKTKANPELSKTQALKEYNAKHRSGISVKLLLLGCKDEGEELELFKEELNKSVINATRKVIPSFFKQIKMVYENPKKALACEEVLKSLIKRLDDDKGLDEDSKREIPTCKMYLLFLLGHHYLKLDKLDTALEYSLASKEHTPTFIENYMLLGKIYKAKLDYPNASKALLDCCNLDRADRYPCNKAAIYQIRENRINEGDQLFKTFMKDDKNNEKNVHDLQKSFYEIPMALAYQRQNKWGRGIRLLNFVYGHFNEIDEEQIEFYTFALRKYSLINFIEMVKLNISKVGENENFIKGNAHFLKYAMAYLRSRGIEDKKKEIAPKIKSAEVKKLKKRQEKFDKTNCSDAQEEAITSLDLNGTKIRDEINLDAIAKKCQMSLPKKDKHKELAYGNLMDYYLDIGNALLAIKAYLRLPIKMNNPHKKFLREYRLYLLLNSAIVEKEKNEAVLSQIESYKNQVFKSQTAEIIKKEYLEVNKDTILGILTMKLSNMHENGTSLLDTVADIEEFIKKEVITLVETINDKDKIRVQRFMKLWSVSHTTILEFYTASKLNIGYFDALNTSQLPEDNTNEEMIENNKK